MTELQKLQARIAELEASNARLAEAKTKKITLKVAEKSKAIQINGMRRFPIVLYKTEMKTLLGMSDQIHEFIQANDTLLAAKPE